MKNRKTLNNLIENFLDHDATVECELEIRMLHDFFNKLVENGYTIKSVSNDDLNTVKNNDVLETINLMLFDISSGITIKSPTGEVITLAIYLGNGDCLPIHDTIYESKTDLEKFEPILNKLFGESVYQYSVILYNKFWKNK